MKNITLLLIDCWLLLYLIITKDAFDLNTILQYFLLSADICAIYGWITQTLDKLIMSFCALQINVWTQKLLWILTSFFCFVHRRHSWYFAFQQGLHVFATDCEFPFLLQYCTKIKDNLSNLVGEVNGTRSKLWFFLSYLLIAT